MTKFKFDVRIKEGYYSAIYFLKTQKILKKYFPNNIVTMQFFQRQDNVMLCGIDEVVALLKEFVTPLEKISVYALNDGDIIKANIPVLKITGPYHLFGYLEGIIDGILARRSSVATNCNEILKVSNDKPLIFMFDRNDDYLNQQGDGYAAYIAGIKSQVTRAQTEWWNNQEILVGTMPHALIHGFNGDIIKSLEAYSELFPNDKLVALVDFDNDVINTSLKVCRHFQNRLSAVRVDTSISLVDKYFTVKENQGKYYNENIMGINPILIKALRKAMDDEGFNNVKIIVSSGFDKAKISWFVSDNTPVDFYGVGATIGKFDIHFTGDLVQLNNKNFAKVGRENIENDKLVQKI
ncbi:nicotinate phosphoribosyltransferase [Spiroplasma endosymbiont of Eupeodes luniger]|uniref:nicotinate phosphoribosyltransferase n=1 Tax=Spiroplasma endosymbiont of Eupeodes luniger TaxID=3066300 RepID=UPI0030D47726